MPLRVIEITKTYPMGNVEVRALRGISFEVADQEYLAIRDPPAPASPR